MATATETGGARVPDGPADYAALDLRLRQEMARSAAQYDGARADLAAHHRDMVAREADITGKMAALRARHLDGLLDGTGPGLTPGVAGAAKEYLGHAAALHRVRQARRLSYGATVPPGQARLGGAIGDPVG